MELLNRDNHQVSRAMLMKKMWQHYESSQEFDDMLASFDAAGMITTSSVGNQILYTMPANQVGELQEYMKGKTR